MKIYLKWSFLAFVVSLFLVFLGMETLDHRLHNSFNRTLVTTKYLESAVTEFKHDFGYIPTEKNMLEIVLANSKNKSFMDKIPKDRWGSLLLYKKTTTGFFIYSIGPDGIDNSGLGDDVVSKKKEYNCKLYNNCPKFRENLLKVVLATLALSFLSLCLGLLYAIFRYFRGNKVLK